MVLLTLEICGAALVLFITIAIGVGFVEAMREDISRNKRDEQQPVEPDTKPKLKVFWPGRS